MGETCTQCCGQDGAHGGAVAGHCVRGQVRASRVWIRFISMMSLCSCIVRNYCFRDMGLPGMKCLLMHSWTGVRRCGSLSVQSVEAGAVAVSDSIGRQLCDQVC